MVRRELIFFGTLISWMLVTLLGILICPVIIKNSGYWFQIIPLVVLMISITPRYFSKRYNNWLETNPFNK